MTSGVCSGEVGAGSALVWSRCDRPGRMFVEVSGDPEFREAKRFRGPAALESTDFTAKFELFGLKPDERIHYRIQFQDLAAPRSFSGFEAGSLHTASDQVQGINFVWSGDTAGQGFGIDVDRGGMKSYEAMRKLRPEFFVHSGDQIYADGPFPKTIQLDDGSTWKNLSLEGTEKVAETMREFHANYRYNLLDENVRRFNSEVPMLAQWDDHETTNNWYPGEDLSVDQRYEIENASLLAARGRKAFFDYMPLRKRGGDGERIYRAVKRGSLLELFFLDMRTYRGPNTRNQQKGRGKKSALLGRKQLNWLKKAMQKSEATWKIVCSDMPIGLIVADGENFENAANGNGPPLGRELEIAELLSHLKQHNVRNVIWLTADVHYAASHYYDPQLARFADFLPFWEFVSGPLHAGTFGPGTLDNTFGPQVKFRSIPKDMKPNRPPSEGLQFFGQVTIDRKSKALTVRHFNAAGDELAKHELEPA